MCDLSYGLDRPVTPTVKQFEKNVFVGAARRPASASRDAPVELGSATPVEDILATCSSGKRAALIVIDSIQTMHT